MSLTDRPRSACVGMRGENSKNVLQQAKSAIIIGRELTDKARRVGCLAA